MNAAAAINVKLIRVVGYWRSSEFVRSAIRKAEKATRYESALWNEFDDCISSFQDQVAAAIIAAGHSVEWIAGVTEHFQAPWLGSDEAADVFAAAANKCRSELISNCKSQCKASR